MLHKIQIKSLVWFFSSSSETQVVVEQSLCRKIVPVPFG